MTRPIRTPIAILAALALIGALAAIPVAAQTETPACTLAADGSTTEAVTEGVTLTFDSDFVCTDAADAGTWSITVNVSNDSETDVTIDALTLAHATPPFGDDGANTVDTGDSLPLDLAAGASGSFTAGGDYALVETGDGSRVNLHLHAEGTAHGEDAAPFALGITVHVLGPGASLDEDDGNANGDGEGRPSWVPGPPPWVIELLSAIFPDGFPWGTIASPPAAEVGDGEAAAERPVEPPVGPPTGTELPPPATNGDDAVDEAPPSWVSPGGPPAWVPLRGDDDGDDDGGGGPPADIGRP